MKKIKYKLTKVKEWDETKIRTPLDKLTMTSLDASYRNIMQQQLNNSIQSEINKYIDKDIPMNKRIFKAKLFMTGTVYVLIEEKLINFTSGLLLIFTPEKK